MHPFQRTEWLASPWLFWGPLAMTLIMTGILGILGQPMTTQLAPIGIISFEFIWTLEAAQALLAQWGTETQRIAAFVVGFDYLYMVLYAWTIGLGCLHVGAKTTNIMLKRLSVWMFVSIWLAAGCDAVENIAQLALILEHWHPVWPKLSGICAGIKFMIVFVCIGFVLAGYPLVSRKTPQETQ